METNVRNNQLQITEDNPGGLIALAIQKGVDIDHLERLLALKERYDAAQAKKAFLNALSNFQKDVPAIHKNKIVGYTSKNGGQVGYKYAELGDIDEAIKKPMAENGLSKRWEVMEEGDKIICTCVISHVNGHTERTTMSSYKDSSGNKNEIQSRGSAVTYMQRYTLIGALGLTTADADNDGEGTSQPTNVHQSNFVNGNSTELPWLNINDRAGNKTADGIAVINDIAAGKTTVTELQKLYRISKSNLEELQHIKVGSKPIKAVQPISAPDEKPFVIPGNWYAKVEKWQTVDDVIATYKDKKETIIANPELASFVFKEAMKICISKANILSIYNAAKEAINSSPELQKILKAKQAELTK